MLNERKYDPEITKTEKEKRDQKTRRKTVIM